MGKPKFSRKKYEKPSHPWDGERIKEEHELVKKYGLKNKREIWKAKTLLKKYRGQARSLLAKIATDPQSKKECDQLLMHLNRLNILPLNSTLDDVLSLDIEDILSRRLQTLTYLKGLAKSPRQARQLISHGHIAVGGRKTTAPSYLVTKDKESEISYTEKSPLNDPMHPVRPRAELPFTTSKKDKEDKADVEKKTDIPNEVSKLESTKTDEKNFQKNEKEDD